MLIIQQKTPSRTSCDWAEARCWAPLRSQRWPFVSARAAPLRRDAGCRRDRGERRPIQVDRRSARARRPRTARLPVSSHSPPIRKAWSTRAHTASATWHGTAGMTQDTVFWLLSMTKAITATACMQLVEAGQAEPRPADEPGVAGACRTHGAGGIRRIRQAEAAAREARDHAAPSR